MRHAIDHNVNNLFAVCQQTQSKTIKSAHVYSVGASQIKTKLPTQALSKTFLLYVIPLNCLNNQSHVGLCTCQVYTTPLHVSTYSLVNLFNTQ